MKQYFLSYTLADKEITIVGLQRLKEKFRREGVNLYVDILDNIYRASVEYKKTPVQFKDEKNKMSSCQKYVLEQLEKSQRLLILDSPRVMKSEWVLQEVKYARIYDISVEIFYTK